MGKLILNVDVKIFLIKKPNVLILFANKSILLFLNLTSKIMLFILTIPIIREIRLRFIVSKSSLPIVGFCAGQAVPMMGQYLLRVALNTFFRDQRIKFLQLTFAQCIVSHFN